MSKEYFETASLTTPEIIDWYLHWLKIEQAEKLDNVDDMVAGMNKAFDTFWGRIRQIGIMLHLEHEFFKYVSQMTVCEMLEQQAKKAVTKLAKNEAARASDQVMAKAGRWVK
jgi:hypothetical protein